MWCTYPTRIAHAIDESKHFKISGGNTFFRRLTNGDHHQTVGINILAFKLSLYLYVVKMVRRKFILTIFIRLENFNICFGYVSECR
jgi:hypothetical protein